MGLERDAHGVDALSECPHKPGTEAWRAWQQNRLALEAEWRRQEGQVGASLEDKVAAGLPALPTVRGSDRVRPLSAWPEPWRTEVERLMRQPRKADELQCPWCRKRYQRAHAYARHMAGNCYACTNPDAPMYLSGDYEPLVDQAGFVHGYRMTAQGCERAQAVQEAIERETQRVVARVGVAGVEATIAALAAASPGAGREEALVLLRHLDAAGWGLTPHPAAQVGA